MSFLILIFLSNFIIFTIFLIVISLLFPFFFSIGAWSSYLSPSDPLRTYTFNDGKKVLLYKFFRCSTISIPFWLISNFFHLTLLDYTSLYFPLGLLVCARSNGEVVLTRYPSPLYDVQSSDNQVQNVIQ